MSEETTGAAPEAKEKTKNSHVVTSFDAWAFRLTAKNPRNPNEADATWRIGFTGYENPRLHLNTGVKTDPREGYLGGRIDTHVLRYLAQSIIDIATNGGETTITNNGHYDKDGQYSEELKPTSKIVVGRDEAGHVFVAMVAEGYTPVKFVFQYNLEYHSLSKNGKPLTTAESSQLFAINYGKELLETIPIVRDQIARANGVSTKSPATANETDGPADLPPDQGGRNEQYQRNNNGGGNNYNRNGGGYNRNGGGGYNRNNGGGYNRGGGGGYNRGGGGGNYNNGGGYNRNNGGGNNYNRGNNNYQQNNQQSQQQQGSGFDPLADSGSSSAADPTADLLQF